MVDDVARAMCWHTEERQRKFAKGTCDCGSHCEAAKVYEGQTAKARAAIEAMREPTQEMIVAAEDCHHPEFVYRAMIGAALKP